MKRITSWLPFGTRQTKAAKKPRRSELRIQSLEDRTVPAGLVRSIDGTGNNLAHTDWGSAGVDFLRLAPSQYADGISAVGGVNRPSARVISNAVADQTGQDMPSKTMLSAMVYAWGQFIDHDMDLTNTGGTEPLKIPVPTGDPSFDPNSTGTKTINTTRSVFDPATGTTKPRQQVNSITAYLDGSMVYGSDSATAASLRTMTDGLMKTSGDNLLPVDSTGFFQAGDIRANENPELASLQTLFVREHNFQAKKLKAMNPGMTDEQLYQGARAIVIGEIEAITFNEWLPTILGPNAIKPYSGYKPNVNPGISNEFATAAFRFGHSLLGDDIKFLDNNGNEVRDQVSLADAFFNPDLVKQNNIDPILKYLASDPSSELDSKVVDSVRNFLFGPPGAGGLDLASLNIQRGRDHGLADYNTTRAAVGLPKVTSFAQITSDPVVQQKLQQLYGNVNNIDLWVGGLAEDHVPGGNVGPTFRAIIADQFSRLRDGDRFWYQNNMQGKQLGDIQTTSLDDIIKRNTTLTNLQADPFHFNIGVSGVVFDDRNRNGRRDPGEPGIAGRMIQLIDPATGEANLSTTTDANGQYLFNTLNGLETGSYKVREVLPNGRTITTPPPPLVSLTRGEQFSNGIGFGETSSVNQGISLLPPGNPPPANQPPQTPPPAPPAGTLPPQGTTPPSGSQTPPPASRPGTPPPPPRIVGALPPFLGL